MENQKEVASGKTGKDGQCTLRNLASGRFQLEVSKPGYQTSQSTISIEGKEISRDVFLKPSVDSATGKPTLILHIIEKVGEKSHPLEGSKIIASLMKKEVAKGQSEKDGSIKISISAREIIRLIFLIPDIRTCKSRSTSRIKVSIAKSF